MATLSTAASELVLAQLDAIRTNKGIEDCERMVRTMRKSLERFPSTPSTVTPELIAEAEARKQAVAWLTARCERCGLCALATE